MESNINSDKHSKYHELIKEICDEEGINIRFSSDNWTMCLEKDNVKKVIVGYKFDSNGHGLGCLIDDKAALSEVLSLNGVENIHHHIIYNPCNNDYYAKGLNSLDYVKELFNKYNHNIVLKPNNGTSGKGVEHITNEEELDKIYNEMSNKYDTLSLSPYYEIKNEYRVIMHEDEIMLMYQKERPIIYGDGESTLKELLIKFNPKYFSNYVGSNKDFVLKKDEKYIHNWRFNLSGGARANLEVDAEIAKNVSEIAHEASNAIGLQFGSVDIIKTINNKYLVMEINSGVMMENFMNENEEGYLLAKKVYHQAITSLFSK